MAALWRPTYVAIGSNLGHPRDRVLEAFERLSRCPATRLQSLSRLYLARPMGPQNQPDFINAAAGMLTQLSAHAMLDELLQIERAMGRHRTERWGPRLVDLDLIWMHGAPIDEARLTVPHPGVSARNFVLYPLADIAPTLVIPGHGQVSDLLHRVGDAGISVLEQDHTP